MTERYRIPEICKISGLKPKEEGKTRKQKSDDHDGGDEDESEEDQGNAGSKRGGKGKKPAKRGGKKR